MSDACAPLRDVSGLRHLIALPEGPPRGLMVAVHGISRDVRAVFEAFRPLAEREGWALLAPYFELPAFGDYQRLGRSGRGARADLALLRLLAAIRDAHGLSDEPFRLFGYSGGGQFAHRFAMAHPREVRAVSACAAGWYTFPDPKRTFPRGLGRTRKLVGLCFERREFLRIPFHVVVGGEDRERDPALRQSRGLDRMQGETRLERARRWCAAMDRAAATAGVDARTALDVLPGVGHDFDEAAAAGLCERVFERWNEDGNRPAAEAAAQA